MTNRARRFWGVSDDGKVGLLSAGHALIAGVVIGAAGVWLHNWWIFAAMAIAVLRSVITLWLTRKANRPQARTTGDRADDDAHMGADS